MHFPELWDEDSLIFDDTEERELLLRQFQELIGEISADEGYHDFKSDTCPFAMLENKTGTSGNASHTLELQSVFSSSCQTEEPQSICDWPASRIRGTTIRELLAEEEDHQSKPVQDNATHHTIRYDVPKPEAPGDGSTDRLVQRSPGIQSQSQPHKPGMVGIVKLPDGNYYMAMSDTPKQGSPCNSDTVDEASPLVGSTATPTSSWNAPSMDSLSDYSKGRSGGGMAGRFTPKRLFSSGQKSRKTNHTRTPCKRARTCSYLPDPPRPSTNRTDGIPQDIMKDLKVIRIHRRSSYADGDSLVEVQPSSLPGSPTMFAYRDPAGRLRVPLEMQCNQQALATYKRMTPSKTGITPRVVSVCDVTQLQRHERAEPTNAKDSIQKDNRPYASGSPQSMGTMRNENVDRMTSVASITVNHVNDAQMNASLSARKIIKEWGKLRHNI